MDIDEQAIRPLELTGRELCSPASWMIGAATRLVDCWTPQLEWLRLPAARWGAFSLLIREQLSVDTAMPRRWFSRRPRGHLQLDSSTVAVDLRPIGGGNIAHAMIRGVTTVLAIRCALARANLHVEPTAIVPRRTAPYVHDLYRALEIPIIPTDHPIQGRVFHPPLVAPQALQLAADVVPPSVASRLADTDSSLPRRIFVSRRGARGIVNHQSVEQTLRRRGYTLVYPERYSVLDQLKIMWNADAVIGVHGAALALLLPRITRHSDPPLKMVEIFGPGYVVGLYRCLASALGGDWIGVRGRLTAKVVRDLEELGPNIRRTGISNRLRKWLPGRLLHPEREWQRIHQASSFEVDLDALQAAIDTVHDPAVALPEVKWS